MCATRAHGRSWRAPHHSKPDWLCHQLCSSRQQIASKAPMPTMRRMSDSPKMGKRDPAHAQQRSRVADIGRPLGKLVGAIDDLQLAADPRPKTRGKRYQALRPVSSRSRRRGRPDRRPTAPEAPWWHPVGPRKSLRAPDVAGDARAARSDPPRPFGGSPVRLVGIPEALGPRRNNRRTARPQALSGSPWSRPVVRRPFLRASPPRQRSAAMTSLPRSDELGGKSSLFPSPRDSQGVREAVRARGSKRLPIIGGR